ncbi:MAG: glycoside hydrolase family 9 protein, partial [Planctomycetota bacterium]
GDRVWHFEFSRVAEPGLYHVFDPLSGERSEDFEIAEDVHAEVRRHALRTYYYQRCGVAKATPHADPRWTDAPCHVGAGQDTACRPIGDPSGPALDLSGGWHDAGDYNKYVNFADGVVHQLFDAYDAAPYAFDDAAGLPDSGNGVPDLLDECRFELEWFVRMQRPSGGVLHKISVDGFQAASPPSADSAPRWYAPVTASATASACGAFARGALVFRAFPGASEQAFATDLENAALAAWNWLQQNPAFSSYDNAGFSNVDAEDPASWQRIVRVVAASWLARLTGSSLYHNYVTANATTIPELSLLNPQVGWSSPYEYELARSLISYAESPGASPALAQTLRLAFADSMRGDWLPPIESGDDPYRAPISDGTYHWGSNSVRARIGAMYGRAAKAEGARCDRALHLQTARDHAHWLHGVNPLGLCFLSNMQEAGAERSIQEIYHGWFDDGTVWDRAVNGNPGPAPGIVPGGPNQYFAPADAYNGPLLSRRWGSRSPRATAIGTRAGRRSRGR